MRFCNWMILHKLNQYVWIGLILPSGGASSRMVSYQKRPTVYPVFKVCPMFHLDSSPARKVWNICHWLWCQGASVCLKAAVRCGPGWPVVQYSAVRCRIQCSALQYSTVSDTVQYGKVQWSTVHCSRVQCQGALQCQIPPYWTQIDSQKRLQCLQRFLYQAYPPLY